MKLHLQLNTLIGFLLFFIPFSLLHAQPILNSVDPDQQRVHDFITLRGSKFGDSQGTGTVLFRGDNIALASGKAYIWRNDLIQVRVPVGNQIDTATVPIPTDPLQISVLTADGESQRIPFQVIILPGANLRFRQLTSIVNDVDTSTVLGSPNLNHARSKEAELGDVNGDGFPDLIDNNSNNVRNSSHGVLRLNNGAGRFTAISLDPLDPSDTGTFATSIAPGGDFFGNHTSYDADLVDINNDGFLDLIQTAADNTSGQAIDNRLRILMNNAGSVPGRFVEDTASRLPSDAFAVDGCPDDLDHADINNDGNIDFLVTLRTAPQFCTGTTSRTLVFVNSGEGNFLPPITLSAPTNVSTHDAFFVDANNDGFEDVVLAHEWDISTGGPASNSELFLHNGDAANPAFAAATTLPGAASTGANADLNGDGLADFVLARTELRVFLNDPGSPGNFSPTRLTISERPFYDIELGDLNLDGAVDIVAANLTTTAEETVRVWMNDGSGNFSEATAGGASSLLPGIGGYQRLSADLLDFDRDGDLDLYIAGADGQDVGPGNGRGRVPNQLYENLTGDTKLTVTTKLRPFGDPGRFRLLIDGVVRANNVGDGGTTGPQSVSVGAHTVSETGQSGTNLSDYVRIVGGACSPDGTITLNRGDKKACSITNLAKSGVAACRENCTTERDICLADGIDLPRVCVQLFKSCQEACANLPAEPQLTIKKVLQPASDPGRFNLLIDGVARATDIGDGGTTGPQNLNIGLHTVRETGSNGTDPSDYTVVFGGACDANGEVLLAGSERKTCTITNTAPPRLTVRLKVSPPDDSGRFNLRVDGITRLVNARDGASIGPEVVSAGTHRVSQTASAGTNIADYRTFFGGDCTFDGRVTLAQGQSKTCVVTNLAEAGQDCQQQCREERDICLADGIDPPRVCVQLFNICRASCN